MTRRERVFNFIEGKPLDRPPVGLWLHFPAELHDGEAAVGAHMRFVRETEVDILKVMNENLLHDGVTLIRRLDDIGKFRSFAKDHPIMRRQAELVARIVQQAAGDYPVFGTIHGLIASALHQTGFAGHYIDMGYGLTLFCRERPAAMKDAFARVAQSLIDLVDLTLESGADGIFYAALGGEKHFFTDDEFAEYVAPYERQVYEYIKSKTPYDILHMCKAGIDLGRYTHLEPSVVNWGIKETGVTLRQGSKIFPASRVLGGLDNTGPIVNGSREEIRREVAAAIEEMNGHLAVGSDCTLPTDISYERLRQVVEAVRELGGG